MVTRAIASRAVTGLAPTSTIFARPRRSTCDNAAVRARVTGLCTNIRRLMRNLAPSLCTHLMYPLAMCPLALPAPPALPALRVFIVALREKERQAFERHGQINALQLHFGRCLEGAGR